MTGMLCKRCNRRTDGRMDGHTDRSVLTAAWTQLKSSFSYTVYPKKYAHGFCFAVLCCGYTLTDFPISIRLTSLALWQSNNCPSASKATLMNMDKYFMWIHYERLHNHNKAKHNKTVCISLGIYCTSCILKNKANLKDLIAATGLVILLKLDSNRRFFSPCDLEIWWMTPKKANLRDLIAVTSLVILLKLDSNRWFFACVTFKIWWMTPKNNKARLLYIKLCASFRTHWCIQTWVTVQKCPIWVKFDDFF